MGTFRGGLLVGSLLAMSHSCIQWQMEKGSCSSVPSLYTRIKIYKPSKFLPVGERAGCPSPAHEFCELLWLS